ncbi:trf-1 [Bugula neritina]|uniref:Trf-1 n=1 Tax=Bugula neritina TaxID=10212 RepID=A0A7J7K4N8_BUGNE|nr:trf-1 [Bugula neritina]
MPERISPGLGNRLGSDLSLLSGTSSANGRTADIDIAFIEPLQKKYECPICVRVLRYPVQFETCGHRCCSSCLPELLRYDTDT